MQLKLTLLAACATTLCLAAEAPFPDAVLLSGKWQPVVWGTSDSPRPGRLQNVAAAGLAALPDDISLSVEDPIKFTQMQWGDCRLRFELNAKAAVKLLGLYDVVALSGTNPSGWTTYDVRFHAPRWNDGQLARKPRLRVDVNGQPARVMSSSSLETAYSAEQVNELGEQFGPLRLEATGSATLRNVWVGPLESARATSSIPWRNMFEGDTFDGWSFNGGDAEYRIENGEVVGTTVPNTPNSFLITDRDYTDFEFSVEVHGSVAFNAGLQFRSKARNGRGRRNRTYGYQCEIDPSDRRWTAGVYDEANRGWLHPMPFNPELRLPLEKDRWHEFRIFADGSVIKTYLDGKQITHIYDAAIRRGYFGLQVHGVRHEERLDIRWRNVRIRELD